eukprot:6187156-Pleurochrysis_carterae.AAC.1
MSLCVDMLTCSALPSFANREVAPRKTGDSKINSPPWARMAFAMPTQYRHDRVGACDGGRQSSIALWDAHWMLVGAEHLRHSWF